MMSHHFIDIENAMTVSSSNLNSLNSALQFPVKEQIENINSINTEQNSDNANVLINSFSSLLSLFSNVSSLDQKLESPVNTSATDTITSIQQTVFSSLGFGQITADGSNNTIEALTSDAYIENIQASLLTSLQTSLFTATKERATEQLNNLTTEKINSQGGMDIFNQVSKFSFGENGLDISDGFDTVNILQHIPIVSSVYQEVSEHDISAVSKLAGGYLYGGPVGLAFSAVDLTVESLFDTNISDSLINFNYTELFANLITPATTDVSAKMDINSKEKNSAINTFSMVNQLASEVADKS